MRRNGGFSAVELMIVVTIIAILAAFAMSMYTEQMRKSRRAEAKQVLSDYALRQEKWRSNNASYGSLTNIDGLATMASGYYTIALSTPGGNCANATAASSSNSFAITATAAGKQATDTKCATLVLTSLCGVTARTSTPSGNTCW